MVLETLVPRAGDVQPDSLTVDIVAVHGLNGDPKNTWTYSANKHFWLQDSLPLDVKGARILNYGYNADVVFGKSTADIWDHAKGLLGSLNDDRETEDESKRPIVFIAHSLGGIIVKQALVWAHREPQYKAIKDHTLGLVFFGTPHRGSDKATYGKILANVATGVMHKPKSKLISALQSNSEALLKLTAEFKFEAPNLKIATFYETKPMSLFSSLIVDKQSALLELSHEDTQPVDANHRDMCKFDNRNHETYKKLVKRVNRMLKEANGPLLAPDCSISKFRNQHFELPFDVSPFFTGGHDVRRDLRNKCHPSSYSPAQNLQSRFILYGLGGSGKTQMALKFASDHRESFWGVFFIDTSSAGMAEQGFSTMARICKVGDRMEDFKRYLTNSPEPWLLILDNADDPSLDISQYFPVGNRGSIIVTSRNPECRCHATVGSRELREMESDEAINLLLRSGDLPSDDQDLRLSALPIVQTLGYLALAVSHAGASIRQKICSLEDYLDKYTRHRTKLLSSQAVQAGSEYKYTVYTTWELSVESIKKSVKDANDSTAAHALELLTVFGFCHFDDITEEIFKSARGQIARTERCPWWTSNILGITSDYKTLDWNSFVFNEAIQLLSSYSLIHLSGSNNRISLHPLVHSWIRDSLSEEAHLRWWNITISTLTLAINRSSFDQQKRLKAHLRHCIATREINDLLQEDDFALDRLVISSWIIEAYSDLPWEDGLALSERALAYSRRTLGDECYSTCEMSYQRALILKQSLQFQNAIDLLQGQLDVTIRVAGPGDPLTLRTMNLTAATYGFLGRKRKALELAEKSLAICKKSLDESDDAYLEAMEKVASGYSNLGRYEEAIALHKKALAQLKEISHEEDKRVLDSEFRLACVYSDSGQHQAASDLLQSSMEKHSQSVGEDHPDTLDTMVNTAVEYGNIGQPEKGIPLIIKALEVGSRIGLEVQRLQYYDECLEWLQAKSINPLTEVSKTPSKSRKIPLFEDKEIPTRKLWKLWSRSRHRRERSPS